MLDDSDFLAETSYDLDGEYHGEVALALSVVRRAFQDLVNQNRPGEHQDAADFLLIRLWEEDCLWGEILRKILDQDDVARIVSKYAYVINGTVTLRKVL